jgi:hypothetical protein
MEGVDGKEGTKKGVKQRWMGGMREWNNQNPMGRNTRNKRINKRLCGPLSDMWNPKWTTWWQVCAVLVFVSCRTAANPIEKDWYICMAEAAVDQQFIFGTDTTDIALSLPSVYCSWPSSCKPEQLCSCVLQILWRDRVRYSSWKRWCA